MKGCLQILLLLTLPAIVDAQALTIDPKANMVMRGKVFLVVRNAALVNNGSLSDSAGTVHFTGDKDTSISYLGGTKPVSVYNLTVNKTAFGTALKSPVAVQNMLGVYGGLLYPDSNLVLRSDKDLTARVDVIPAGANIIGKSIVERYFPARRSWRLVTSPLTSTTSIFDSWQNKGIYVPGINTAITGPNPTGAGGNGLDASPQNNASMKTWNKATQQLDPVLDTKVKLSPGNNGSADNSGYFLFVRGDRDVNNFNIPNSNITTLRSNGQLQTGTQNFTASATGGGFTLVGNPYASPVDFNGVSITNLVKRFYVWDPTLNLLGAYVMLDDLNNDGVFTKSINASAQTNHLQSSQAFFVETQSNGAANIMFPENSKSAGNNNQLFRPVPSGNNSITQAIRILLQLPQTDSSTITADGVLVECNGTFSDSVDRDDAVKFSNINENLALLRYNHALSAERRPEFNDQDTIFLKLNRTSQRNYRLQLEPEGNYQPGLLAWLEDSYLNSSTPVDLYNKSLIDFAIDANAASAASNRFRIVFKQTNVLPVFSIGLNAVAMNDSVLVNWQVPDETNLVKYEVERSADGIHFYSIKMVMMNNNHQYAIADIQPLSGYNFYRIRYLDATGKTGYSNIMKVLMTGAGLSSVNITPNPVVNNTINLQLSNYPKGHYIITLLAEGGQKVYETNLEYQQATQSFAITPTVHLAAGAYLVIIQNGNDQPVTKKIMVAE